MKILRRLGLLFGFLLMAGTLAAQIGEPPVFELKSDTGIGRQLADTHWQMLADPDGSDLKTIRLPHNSRKFHRNTTDTGGIDFDVKTYWVRYRLKNSLSHPLTITIEEGNTDATVYYRSGKSDWKNVRTGYIVPWSQRDGYREIAHVPLTIEPGDTLAVYERYSFNYSYFRPSKIVTKVYFADKILERAYLNNEKSNFRKQLSSFLMGWLLFATVLNFFFFSAVREKVYLFYGLTLLSVVVGAYDTPLFIYYQEHPLLYHYIQSLAALTQFFFFVQTNRYFINLWDHYPRWDTVLNFSSWLPVITYALAQIVVPAIKPEWAIYLLQANSIVSTIVLLALFVTMVLFIRRKDPISRAYIISMLPVVIWILFGYVARIDAGSRAYQIHHDISDVASAVCIGWMLVIFTWTLIKRFTRLRQEKTELIARQNEELEKQVALRTAELNTSLSNLRAAQSQLIQAEKMASLGELTAGIAHEIQNPLNFVNNFSEVSVELMDEMKEELEKGDTEEAIALASDIALNLEKIRQHGKRADSIVKGMLQHSRTGSGTKESSDINALVDECVRLSYHGVRARDKSFNVTLETKFDENAGNAPVVKQDLTRVILNILTNAFYAVNKRAGMPGEGYKPLVTVSTARAGETITIRIRDNGIGIPASIADKIFQPFFTTKPTGEGTGLGLSLSYDIITKGHGGELRVESVENEYTEFIVQIPG